MDNGVNALKSGHGTEGKLNIARKGSVVSSPPKGMKILPGGASGKKSMDKVAG